MPINPENRAVVVIAAVLACGLLAYNYTWWTNLRTHDGELPSSLPVPIRPPAPSVSSLANAIVERHPFGVQVTAHPPAPTEVLPETLLQLTLKGVAVSSNEKSSSAMIAGPDGKVRNYLTGKELPGGVVLSRVFQDKVVLERDGSFETLLFPQPKQIANARVIAASVQETTAGVSRASQTVSPGQTARSSETVAARDARITAQLQQQRNSRNTLSLEERLNKLREGKSKL